MVVEVIVVAVVVVVRAGVLVGVEKQKAHVVRVWIDGQGKCLPIRRLSHSVRIQPTRAVSI